MSKRSFSSWALFVLCLAGASPALATGFDVKLGDGVHLDAQVFSVPEPTPLMLLGVGLVGLAIAGRRKRKP